MSGGYNDTSGHWTLSTGIIVVISRSIKGDNHTWLWPHRRLLRATCSKHQLKGEYCRLNGEYCRLKCEYCRLEGEHHRLEGELRHKALVVENPL